ncbi:hypothetical protein D9M69_429560 [compost metagenome]
MEGVFHAGVDELDHHFDEVLQPARLTGGGLLGRPAEQQDEHQAEEDGPAEGIDVERPEAHFLRLFSGVGESPVTVFQSPEGQVRQVVLDIARSGLFCHVCLKRPKVSKILLLPAGVRTS